MTSMPYAALLVWLALHIACGLPVTFLGLLGFHLGVAIYYSVRATWRRYRSAPSAIPAHW